MKPDLDAIRALCEAAQVIFERSSVVAPCVYDDIPALLAYIDELERDLLNERATFESCNRARMHCEYECATLKARTTYTVGETEWAHRIATLEHMLSEERENVDTLRARVTELEGETSMLREQISVRIEDVSMFKRLYEEQIQDDNAARAELEAEVAILRPWSVMLKRAHGALTDAGCVVPLEFDQSIERAINDLARRATRAEQLFVDEYDARKAAERERDEALARLPVDGSNMPSIVDTLEDDNAALRAEIAELKARIAVLEAMKP